ncbi:MAG TPA: type VI secretion system-associated protein TagF [Burkholderiales bacterium]
MRAAAAPGTAFAVGWYGKIPRTGDFIARRVSPSFREPWDRWLQQAIAGSQRRLCAGWRDAYLSMPAWRFVLGPGVLDAHAWAGLMVPSVDAVGRYFPLTVACALPSASLDAAATLLGAARWFDEIEAIALEAIAPGADIAAIDAALAQRRFEARWLALPESGDATTPIGRSQPPMLCISLPDGAMPESGRLRVPQSAWLAEPSEVFDRALLLCESLPAGEQFCAMMDGHWLEHGWAWRSR